jgi:hypothetical protein
MPRFSDFSHYKIDAFRFLQLLTNSSESSLMIASLYAVPAEF